MNSNSIASVGGAPSDAGYGPNGRKQSSTSDQGSRERDDPKEPVSADVRLIIEENGEDGTVIYKTINHRTGEIVSQLQDAQILRMREALDYVAGAVIKTKA
jgi:flagellar protein FlaG